MWIASLAATAAFGQEHPEPDHVPTDGHGEDHHVEEAAPEEPADEPIEADLHPEPAPEEPVAELDTHTELDSSGRSFWDLVGENPALVRGFWGGVGLVLLTLVLLALAQSIERLRNNLLPTGILPRAAGVSSTALRVAALFTGLGALGAWVPEAFAWAVPLVVAGAAVAIGFFATRDVLPDLLAGFTLSIERRLRVGQWLETAEFAGSVESVGLRAIWLRDANGRLIAIPNRELLNATVASAEERFPALEVVVQVPGNHPSQRVRRVLMEAVLVSPWIAPREAPSLVRDAAEPNRWRVRARLLEGHFADRFEGALRERIDDALRVG